MDEQSKLYIHMHVHVVLKIIISRIKQVIKGLTAAVSELMSYRIYIKTDKVIYRGRFARRHENKEKKPYFQKCHRNN